MLTSTGKAKESITIMVSPSIFPCSKPMTSKVPPERACITCNMFSLLTIKNDFGFVTIFRRATAEIFTFLKWLGLNQSQVAIFKLRLNLLFQPSTLVNKWLMAFLIISIEFVRINVLYLVLCLKSKPRLCRVHAGGVLLWLRLQRILSQHANSLSLKPIGGEDWFSIC